MQTTLRARVVHTSEKDERLVNSKKRQTEGLLFPGYGLEARVKKRNHASQLVGDVFEGLSKSVSGADRLTTDSGCTCPDLEDREMEIFFECKASQKRNYFKVSAAQLLRYEHTQATNHYVFKYHLWSYALTNITKQFPTIRAMIDALVANVANLDVLDMSILSAVLKLKPEGTLVRTYNSWKNEKGEPFYVIQLTHSWLHRLRTDTHSVLAELGLNPVDYLISNGLIEQAVCVFQDVLFTSRPFPVFTCERAVTIQEFDEDEKVPF